MVRDRIVSAYAQGVVVWCSVVVGSGLCGVWSGVVWCVWCGCVVHMCGWVGGWVQGLQVQVCMCMCVYVYVYAQVFIYISRGCERAHRAEGGTRGGEGREEKREKRREEKRALQEKKRKREGGGARTVHVCAYVHTCLPVYIHTHA